MTDKHTDRHERKPKPENTYHACYCIGPQSGQPLCPCQMRNSGVFKREGRWVIPEKDLGPVCEAWPLGRGT